MEKIVTIQPFYNRIDKEIEPYLDFLEQMAPKLDPSFNFERKILDEKKMDKPYELQQIIIKYGNSNQGFEIIQEEEYEQIAYGICVDRVIISTYGLSENKKLEIVSAREWSNPPFLELRLKGKSVVIDEIVKRFHELFEIQVKSQENLKRELMILKISIKRSAWYPVEVRAKNILKDFPKEPFALFAYAIARAAQGDLEAGEEILQRVLKIHPNDIDSLYNLGVIYTKKEKFDEALKVLNEAINLEPQNHPVYWMLGQVNEALGNIDDALEAYDNALKTSPNPMGYGFISLDFTAKAKEAIKRLKTS
ncbi:MAG: tetratricopeptide repeat protein [Candidatus Heimdallarchaeota archaeon]|nr:tetratricopeptide repeat protein [Candidatus Heimdallarchaeota archaeon]